MLPRFLVIILSVFMACTAVTVETQDLTPTLAMVSGDSLSADIRFLASDSLKGRSPGTPEYGIAVEYVIRKFRLMGIEPAGENGEFTQPVTIRNSRIYEAGSSMEWNNRLLVQNQDFYFIANLNQPETELTARVIFAGYGIESPNYDDFSMIDVAGKVLLVLTGGPELMQSAEFAHFGNLETKYKTASEKGAAGILFINANPSRDSTFNSRASSVSVLGNFGVVGKNGTAFGDRVFSEPLKFSAYLNFISLASPELDSVISGYKENKIAGQELGSITVKTQSIFSEFLSSNVVGKITGTDSNLKDEFVVHTAHLDHVGIGRPVDGDSIYNGAHDNASGVASLLEIARIYQTLEKKPKRSMLFVVVTAEEMGLLGSDYFTTYPTVPLENLVANINADMPTLIAPLLSIEPLGAEHSSLMNEVERAAEELNLEIMEDHMPEEVRFVRSDQYNFMKRGIPAVHVKYGLKTNDPETDLRRKIRQYTRNVYHKPSDEWNDLFDFQAGEVYVRCNFLISYFIANNPSRPTFNEDSFLKRFSDGKD